MDILMSEELWTLLLISVTFSIFLMATVQKIKMLEFIHRKWQVWLINFICAFAMGIPFGMMFYQLTLEESIWVGVFGFIGAPGIYAVLKKQNIIQYTPQSATKNKTCITNANEIKRDDLS